MKIFFLFRLISLLLLHLRNSFSFCFRIFHKAVNSSFQYGLLIVFCFLVQAFIFRDKSISLCIAHVSFSYILSKSCCTWTRVSSSFINKSIYFLQLSFFIKSAGGSCKTLEVCLYLFSTCRLSFMSLGISILYIDKSTFTYKIEWSGILEFVLNKCCRLYRDTKSVVFSIANLSIQWYLLYGIII